MKKYFCPMHPEIQSDKSGSCSKCHMQLVKKGQEQKHIESKSFAETVKELIPLFIIIGGVMIFTFIWSFVFGLNSWSQWM